VHQCHLCFVCLTHPFLCRKIQERIKKEAHEPKSARLSVQVPVARALPCFQLASSMLKCSPSFAVDKAHVAASQWPTEDFPAARLSVLPHAQACADSFSNINSFSLIFGGSSSFFLLFFREREGISRENNMKQER